MIDPYFFVIGFDPLCSQLDIERQLPDDADLESDEVPVHVHDWPIIRADEEQRHFFEEGFGLFRDEKRPSSRQL